LKALAISVQSNAAGTRATSRLRLAAARNIFKNEAAVFQVAAYTTQTWAANTPYAKIPKTKMRVNDMCFLAQTLYERLGK
jgi:hypothetical protein